MRIFIITMEDPLYTVPFIKEIIREKHANIVGVATASGNRFTIGKKRSKTVYLFTLLLIMGPWHFTLNIIKTLVFKFRVKLSSLLPFVKSPSVLAFALQYGIPVYKTASANSKSFLETVRSSRPDVIINQSQSIIKKELLSIPSIGIINRHNALLPKNRGRLTPFWVLFKEEKETGVSIHFVDEGIDSGAIIVQERFAVADDETFNSLVEKNYKVAPRAMIHALHLLEKGGYKTIGNSNEQATYNGVPAFRDALVFRLRRIMKKLR